MTISEPIWWEYIVLEDVDGVGLVKGFKKDTPKEIIDAYKSDIKMMKKNRKENPFHLS